MTEARNGIRAVLFDKDGTLFDFREVWVPAYRAAAQEMADAAGGPELATALLQAAGYDPAADRFAPTSCLVSGTAVDIAEAWRPLLGAAAPSGLAARIEKTLDAWSSRPVAPVTDLDDLFGGLVARGLNLGIATMDSSAALEATLARWPWRRHLSFSCGYDSGHGEKPEAGMALAFARSVGARPVEIAVVGDSLADMAMARAAGAGLAIGVASGPTPANELRQAADHVLQNTGEIELFLYES